MKLSFELIPRTCWNQNLRTMLKPSHWDRLRKASYAKADGRCMICDCETNRLEAHEQWEYNEEEHIQILSGIIAICKNCHNVIHIGCTQQRGYESEAKQHFMDVNNCSVLVYNTELLKSRGIYESRSKIKDWKLDITWLENQGIKVE